MFSATDEFRLLADPDTLNTESYSAWSFAHGCDTSHGDSGSAIVDRATGRPIGIHWTGKVPKSSRVRTSGYLADLLASPSDDVWSELGYAVPAAKIKEVVSKATRDGSVTPSDASILSAVVAD